MATIMKLNPLFNPKTVNDSFPNILYSQMEQDMSFVGWNTRGVNNDTFKMNLKEIIQNYNPCLVALRETKMINHSIHKDVFVFYKMFEVSAVGNSG